MAAVKAREGRALKGGAWKCSDACSGAGKPRSAVGCFGLAVGGGIDRVPLKRNDKRKKGDLPPVSVHLQMDLRQLGPAPRMARRCTMH